MQGFYFEPWETLNQFEMFSRHFVKTPICNQYCYRPAPVSNSKSICFKIQKRLPSTMWAEELRTSQIRLRWKYHKTCILKVVSWFWLTVTTRYFIIWYIWKSMRFFVTIRLIYVFTILSLNLSLNDLEACDKEHLLLTTTEVCLSALFDV